MKVSTDMVKWARDSSSGWAAQVTKYKDKYYLYFCTWDKTSEGKQSIGVAVADRPTGPFKDVGAPLIKGILTVPQNNNWDDIDPTVWIETDGKGAEHRYLAWGNSQYYICELNEDMISVKDLNGDGKITCGKDSKTADIINRSPSGYTEAPWIYRRKDANGKYYGEYYVNSSSERNYPYKDVKVGAGIGKEAADSKWLIMEGKADKQKGAYVSIQSENKPGLYLTANSTSSVTLAQDIDASAETAKRQTFRTVQGLTGSKGVSFESVAYPGYFLTIVNGTLTLQDGADKEAATFYTSIDTEDTSLRSIAANVKKLKVKVKLTWKKAKGQRYEISYGGKKTQHKKLGTVKISKKMASYSRSVKTWEKGKTYYFHIRAYSMVNGVKQFGSYKTVKVKIK